MPAGDHVGVADRLDLLHAVTGDERVPRGRTPGRAATPAPTAARRSDSGVKPTMSAKRTVTAGRSSAITPSCSLSRAAIGAGSTFSSSRSDLACSSSSRPCCWAGRPAPAPGRGRSTRARRTSSPPRPRTFSAKNAIADTLRDVGRARGEGRVEHRGDDDEPGERQEPRDGLPSAHEHERPERRGDRPQAHRGRILEPAEAPLQRERQQQRQDELALAEQDVPVRPRERGDAGRRGELVDERDQGGHPEPEHGVRHDPHARQRRHERRGEHQDGLAGAKLVGVRRQRADLDEPLQPPRQRLDGPTQSDLSHGPSISARRSAARDSASA